MEQIIQASKFCTVEEYLLSMLQGFGGFIRWLVRNR